jgi:hypothetical protein
MEINEFRRRYFEAIGVQPHQKKRLARALARAHDIRKFEIDLYWRRATYFWAFQVVAFATFGLLLRDDGASSESIAAVAALGTLTATAGYVIARSSRFWQDTWEAHVDLLEPANEARLAQVTVLREQPQFSVTRINQNVLIIIAVWWLAILILAAFPPVAAFFKGLPELWRGSVIVEAVFATAAVLLRTGKSRIVGRAWFGVGEWRNYSTLARREQFPRIMWSDRADI